MERYERVLAAFDELVQLVNAAAEVERRLVEAYGVGDMDGAKDLYRRVPSWRGHPEQNRVVLWGMGAFSALSSAFADLHEVTFADAGRDVEKIRGVLKKRPLPPMQLLTFSDMPQEILHRVAWMCDNRSTRAMAVTSRLFNRVAGPYAWTVRLLVSWLCAIKAGNVEHLCAWST